MFWSQWLLEAVPGTSRTVYHQRGPTELGDLENHSFRLSTPSIGVAWMRAGLGVISPLEPECFPANGPTHRTTHTDHP
jgi:hypothetical protein